MRWLMGNNSNLMSTAGQTTRHDLGELREGEIDSQREREAGARLRGAIGWVGWGGGRMSPPEIMMHPHAGCDEKQKLVRIAFPLYPCVSCETPRKDRISPTHHHQPN